jgi:UDP-3-O-[3-hydroxymyristoyl] glucosamine N-acyltransferase
MHTLSEIAKFLQAELKGDANYAITGIAPLEKARENQISFFGKAEGFVQTSRQYLATTKAGAVILTPKDAEGYAGNVLLVADPYVSYAKLTSLFNNAPKIRQGIHEKAVVGKNVSIGEDVIIEAGCVIGDGAKIGDNCHLYPNVIVYHDVCIGDRVIIHSGAVIGADGFGMANDKGKWCKIYQLASVQIGDDVEIGANTCIDRGALEDTIIEDGVKLDNHIQIGHNVKIGAHTVIAGCTGVAGSTAIGKHCMIGGAVNINGHINITDQVIITGASTLMKDIEKSGVYSSTMTVQPHRAWMKILSRFLKLAEKRHA